MTVIDVMIKLSVSISIVCFVLTVVMAVLDGPTNDTLTKSWVIAFFSMIASGTATLICGVWVT